MAGIRARDTKPELALRRALRRHGLTGYRIHYRKIVGNPDICFVGRRVAVFVDGAFWHGHPDYFTFGKSGPRWDEKIRRNRARDEHVNSVLAESGWRVLRFWDFEVRAGADGVAASVAEALQD